MLYTYEDAVTKFGSKYLLKKAVGARMGYKYGGNSIARKIIIGTAAFFTKIIGFFWK